jgi:transcriptional regulator with XRE-family HTH domain
MSKRGRPTSEIPTLVAERLKIWGKCIRKQRVSQNITAHDLCARLDISRPTLVRMEHGEGNVNAALYLAALNILGVLAFAVPELDITLWQMDHWDKRARPDVDGSDYF